MTLRFKDVRPGMCWRFTSPTAPDHKPTYTMEDDEADPCTLEPKLPQGWDNHYYENPDSDDHSEFFEKHHSEPIQLLMHYEKAPHGRPLEEYEAWPARDVRPHQWYLGGEWNEASAKSVAASLNRLEVRPASYRSGHGPSSDSGWAVVRTTPVAPPISASTLPRVRSCVDPLDKMLTTLRTQKVGGVDGVECLWRYEYAQKHEQLARTQHGFVSTNGDYPMDEGQVALAQELWAVELKARRRDAVKKAALQVVCDDQYEL